MSKSPLNEEISDKLFYNEVKSSCNLIFSRAATASVCGQWGMLSGNRDLKINRKIAVQYKARQPH